MDMLLKSLQTILVLGHLARASLWSLSYVPWRLIGLRMKSCSAGIDIEQGGSIGVVEFVCGLFLRLVCRKCNHI